MLIKHSPDANTETGSSPVDAKTQAGDSSSTEEKTKSSPLAEAMKVAEAAEGGEGEALVTDEEDDSQSRSKIEQDKEDASTEGDKTENLTEGDEEQDEKVEENETEKGDDEKVDGDEQDADKSKELTAEQKAENERFDKHPRFVQLNERLKEAETKSKSYDGIQEYCNQHGITPKQFNEGMQLMGLMNVDPVKARAALLPYMDSLNAYVGEKLPDDLQKRVDGGTIDINDAKEIAKLRAQTTMSQTRSAQTQEQVFNASCSKAVSDWETSKKATDPDYAKKYDLIEPVFMGLLNTARGTGKEPSPQDRVRFAEQAWKQVTDKLVIFMPQRPTKRSFKTNGSRTTGASEAKTPFELAAQIAARAK